MSFWLHGPLQGVKKIGPVSRLITQIKLMLPVTILIDRPKSTQQLQCNRALQFSKSIVFNMHLY